MEFQNNKDKEKFKDQKSKWLWTLQQQQWKLGENGVLSLNCWEQVIFNLDSIAYVVVLKSCHKFFDTLVFKGWSLILSPQVWTGFSDSLLMHRICRSHDMSLPNLNYRKTGFCLEFSLPSLPAPSPSPPIPLCPSPPLLPSFLPYPFVPLSPSPSPFSSLIVCSVGSHNMSNPLEKPIL